MLTGKPVLAGESDSHQLDLIWDLMGSPTEENMPGWKRLPGGDVLSPRVRPGNLSTRFREYVYASALTPQVYQTNLIHRHGSGAISLLKELLKLDWKTRINAGDALQHPYFKMAPLPANPADLPTFEESHEFDRRKFQDRRAALPPAPKGGTVGRGPEANGAASGMNSDAYPGRNGMGGPRHPGPRNGDERRPAWERGRGLPPRPPPPERNGWDGDDRDRRPRSRGNRGPDVDTYIPSYRDRDGGRSRDDRPRDDRPREDRPRDERRRWDDRERWHEREHRRTRSRSRSPVRDHRR